MFRGQFQHAVDQKGRISLPVRFREALVADGDPRLILTPAPFDPCLHIYPLRAWEQYEQKIADLPSHDPRIVRFRRIYVSPAFECELDKAGRIRIPEHFREQTRLLKDVLLAGMGRIIEAWSKELWDEQLKMTAAEAADFKSAVQELIRV